MPTSRLKTVYTIAELRQNIALARTQNIAPAGAKDQKIALVPTMGNLHPGHISLVKTAARHAAIVIVTIFVNPAQFAPGEDFASYPRSLERDRKMLEEAGVNILFTPSVTEIYPAGFATRVAVDGLTDCLCGNDRPDHFQGVTTVVAKLLIQALPDVAIFGKKDFQQLQIIRRMARDLDLPVEIIASPIWREKDGLAMSSRNSYLDDTRRAIAPILYKVISEIAWKAGEGALLAPLLADGRRAILAAGFDSVDYLEIRDAEKLTPITKITGNKASARVFVAARLGQTRLIDNKSIGKK